ncbi:MAG: LapA family protein [Gammaproteobacteria bacterium]|nr:LapA family protein [Gammaproteobacteria bacterium]
MKRLFYAVLAIAILLVGVTLTVKNSQAVEFNYYFGIHWEAPLAFMLLTVLTVGIVLGLFVSVGMLARMQRQLAQARRDNRKMETDLHNLRTLPIRDVP